MFAELATQHPDGLHYAAFLRRRGPSSGDEPEGSVVVIDNDMNLRSPRILGRSVLALHRARIRSNFRPKEDGAGQPVLSSSRHSTARTGTIAGSVVVNASIRPPPLSVVNPRGPRLRVGRSRSFEASSVSHSPLG